MLLGAQQHTTVESAAALRIQDKTKGKYDENIYVMHQQDRLLSCQLHPTFPPAWTECG